MNLIQQKGVQTKQKEHPLFDEIQKHLAILGIS